MTPRLLKGAGPSKRACLSKRVGPSKGAALSLWALRLSLAILCCPSAAAPRPAAAAHRPSSRSAAAASRPAAAAPRLDPCGDDAAEARPALTEGRRQFDAGERLPATDENEVLRAQHYEAALRCYRHAQAVAREGAEQIYPQIGLAHQRLGQFVEAYRAYGRYLAEVPAAQRKDGATTLLSRLLAEVEPRVTRLTVLAPAGAAISIDDGPPVGVAPLGAPLVLPPGSHFITLVHPQIGRRTESRDLGPGKAEVLDLSGWSPPPPPPKLVVVTPPPPPPPPPWWRRVPRWGWVAVGVGAAAVVAGGVTGIYFGTVQTRPDVVLR